MLNWQAGYKEGRWGLSGSGRSSLWHALSHRSLLLSIWNNRLRRRQRSRRRQRQHEQVSPTSGRSRSLGFWGLNNVISESVLLCVFLCMRACVCMATTLPQLTYFFVVQIQVYVREINFDFVFVSGLLHHYSPPNQLLLSTMSESERAPYACGWGLLVCSCTVSFSPQLSACCNGKLLPCWCRLLLLKHKITTNTLG